MLSDRIAVVLFAGNCRRESREKHLPPRLLAALHAHIAGVITRLESIDLIVASCSDGRFRLRGRGGEVTLPDTGLPGQIDSTLRVCFSRGYASVLLLAGDVVGITAAVLTHAVEALTAAPDHFVLGRSGDGGFYLAGFNRIPEIDWSAVPWCGPAAAEVLSFLACEAGFIEVSLPRIDDIDSPEDARRAASSIRGSAPLIELYCILVSVVSARAGRPAPSPSAPRRAWRPSARFRAPPPRLAVTPTR